MSDLYIPPKEIIFKIKNYRSGNILYDNKEHGLFIWKEEDYENGFWYLVHVKDKYYKIKNNYSGKCIYYNETYDKLVVWKEEDVEDCYWEFVPTIQNGFFKIKNNKNNKFMYHNKEYGIVPWEDTDQIDNQWTFIFEDMKVDKIEYNFDEGKILNTKTEVIANQVLTNNSDVQQTMIFKVEQSEIHSTNFEYSQGFSIKLGMEFSVGIPFFAESKFNVETTLDQSWTFGETKQFEKRYSQEFPLTALPKSKIKATASVNKGNLNVPYIMTLKSKRTGFKVETKGIFSGVSTWDLRYVVENID